MDKKSILKNDIKNLALNNFLTDNGGPKKVSELLGVPKSSVSRWLRLGICIPVKHAIQMEIISKGKFKANEFRPDVMKKHCLTKD